MRVELRDSLEFLYADSSVAKRPCCAMTVDVARGGTAAVHVLVNVLKKGSLLRLAARQKGRAAAGAQWFRLVDVPVEVNTGPVGFIEKKGERNRFVTRRAPFRVYDAMEPAGSAVRVSSPTQALRLHVPIPPEERPGMHEYEADIALGGEARRLSFAVHVHKAVVPPVGRESFPYTNWFSFELMAGRHGLAPWTEAHWRQIGRYAEVMVHARQNMFWVPLRDIFRAEGKMPVLDRERLRRIVRVFTEAGMHYIEGGHVATRTGGEWNATTFDTTVVRERATSVEGNAVIARIGRQLMEEIERNGWRSRWIQHATDEPTGTNAVDYRILVGMVRRHFPGVQVLDATMDPGLAGSVDIWCPQAQHYQRDRRRFEAQQKLGDRVWFYTCCFPGGPWLTRLLDMELLRPALFGWGAARFGLEGFLHWGLNHYRRGQDPFKKSVVGHGGGNFLPAGDTHVVYPGKDGPWSSLRLEAQREGFEDYELLRRLKAREARKTSRIIRIAFRAFDDYTKDVKEFRAARGALLRSLP